VGAPALVLLASAAILIEGAILVCGPEPRLAHLFYDDAFYYFQVAKNLAAGVGSTFDGFNLTNGYHPLWCWVLVPIFWVTSDPGLGMRVAAALWFLLAAAVPPAMYAVVRPRTGEWGATLAAVGTLHPFLVLHLQRPSGLETPLFALLLLIIVGAFESMMGGERGASRLQLLGLGALLGAAVLARMDAGLYALAAAAILIVRLRPRALALITLGAAIVAGPSLAWNTAKFGSPMPISGRVVRAYQEKTLERTSRLRVAADELPTLAGRYAVEGTPPAKWIATSGAIGGVLLLGVGTALVAAGLLRRRGRPFDALALLSLGSAIHFAVYAFWFWTGGEEALFRLYYFMPEGLTLAAACGAALSPAWARRLAAPLLVVMTLYLALACRASFAEAPSAREPMTRHHLYGWVRENLPEDAVLAMLGSGRLGYFSGRRVINLDGLVNGTEFLDALKRDDVDGFLFRSPARYVVTHRGSLFGFDPDHPENPPSPRADMGETLYRLASRHGCRLRTVPGSPDTTVVVEILRP
jgi:hypothetical protein